jgi:Uma2 family endonuclease
MATAPHRPRARKIDYPTGDGKPMAETDIHRDDMIDLLLALGYRFADDLMTYVSGNLLLFYEEGNRRKHVSPDVFVVRGIQKKRRLNYLVWQEGKGPDFVLELTSKTTRREDQEKKLCLYRDVLRVPEYFQFDPTGDYLKPSLQGFRLSDGDYVPITPVDGRIPSEVLGLHLEQHGTEVRLYDPRTRSLILKPGERVSAAENRAQTAEQRAQTAETRAQTAETRAQTAEQRAAATEALNRQTIAENERLRRELEAFRQRSGSGE